MKIIFFELPPTEFMANHRFPSGISTEGHWILFNWTAKPLSSNAVERLCVKGVCNTQTSGGHRKYC